MKNGLSGATCLASAMKLDRLVDQIVGEVIAFLGRLRRLDLMVVVDQLRIILVRVAAEEAVEAVEAASQRPAVVGSRGADLLRGREVPLADGVGVVAVLLQHLGEEAVFEGNIAVAARDSRSSLR